MSYSSNRRSEGFEIEPKIFGYQLIGDSQFLRFSEQLLGRRRRKESRLAYLGLCVSGQKTLDLLRRVNTHFHPTAERAVLMIGTNDLLQGTNVNDMCNTLDSLVCKLVERGVSKLILLTVPPVPRLDKSSDHWTTLKEFNTHIKTLHNGEDIFVVDVYPHFVRRTRDQSTDRSAVSTPVSTNGSSSSPTPPRKPASTPYSINFPRFANSESTEANGGNPVPLKTDLRISLGEKRKVYQIESEDEYQPDANDSYNYVSGLDARKRRRTTDTANESSSSLAEDDHDDRFYEDESSFVETVRDEIKFDLFEEYFSGDRKDLIHLNNRGLRLIRSLIEAEIKLDSQYGDDD